MGAAAYRRGSANIAREARERVSSAVLARVDRQAHVDEANRLREVIARLERDLARARRCIAELRRSKDARMQEARSEVERSSAAVKVLCLVAFKNETSTGKSTER